MYLSTILSTFNSHVVDMGVRSLSPGFKEKEKDIEVRPGVPMCHVASKPSTTLVLKALFPSRYSLHRGIPSVPSRPIDFLFIQQEMPGSIHSTLACPNPGVRNRLWVQRARRGTTLQSQPYGLRGF